MEERREDVIDIDAANSDIPFLRRCSNYQTRSSPIASSPLPSEPRRAQRPIPGPAAAIQAVMQRTSAPRRDPTASFPNSGRTVDPVGEEDDGDFNLNPWLCATRYLDNCSSMTITSIKDCNNTTERVPWVLGIVISCMLNGLGGMIVTLKDPTGTIGASIHSRVVMDGNLGGDLAVGCVLILKQVVVFCPNCLSCYLNVTLNNVVKLISRDCGPSHKQMMPPFKATPDSIGEYREIGMEEAERAPLLNKENRAPHKRFPAFTAIYHPTGNQRENGWGEADAASSVTPGAESMAADDLRGNRNPECLAGRFLYSSNSTAPPPTKVAKTDPKASEYTSKADRVMARNLNARMSDNMEADGSVGSLSLSTNDNAPPRKAAKIDLRASEPRTLISKATVAEWTDEQLLELFSDYQDDAELCHPLL